MLLFNFNFFVFFLIYNSLLNNYFFRLLYFFILDLLWLLWNHFLPINSMMYNDFIIVNVFNPYLAFTINWLNFDILCDSKSSWKLLLFWCHCVRKNSYKWFKYRKLFNSRFLYDIPWSRKNLWINLNLSLYFLFFLYLLLLIDFLFLFILSDCVKLCTSKPLNSISLWRFNCKCKLWNIPIEKRFKVIIFIVFKDYLYLSMTWFLVMFNKTFSQKH